MSGDPCYRAARDRAEGVTDTLALRGLDLVRGRPLLGAWSERWGRTAVSRLIDA